MKDKIIRLEGILAQSLRSGYSFEITENSKGVFVVWCKLISPLDIRAMANAIKTLEGRLSTITAYQLKQSLPSEDYEIAYHFDLFGATINVTVQLVAGNNKIYSLTPIFRNADWNEREFMELYDIDVIDHPNPQRLFIDETIESSVLQRYIPYSAMVNAASTKTLWENIMHSRGLD